MTRSPALCLLCVIPIFARAQGPVSAAAPGKCSSAIAAGNNNQVTIRCSGMSEAKANQLIALMNKVLAERLDLSDVNKKLDELGAQMTDVGSALNPMAGAPMDVVKLYEEGQELAQKVQSLQTEWNGRLTDANLESVQRTQQDVAARSAALSAAVSERSSVTAAKQAEYKATLEPKLEAFDIRVRRMINFPAGAPDQFANPRDARFLGIYVNTVSALANSYEMMQRRTGAPVDPSVRAQANALMAECQRFEQGWQSGSNLARLPGPPAMTTLASIQGPIDAEESEKYRTTLEARMVAWRKRVQVSLPSYQSSVDYSHVTTARRLGEVYLDMMQIGQAYQRKRQNEALEKRAQ